MDLSSINFVSGEEANHLAMGHYIKHPKKPYYPNVFLADIEMERHFLPNSMLSHMPNGMYDNHEAICFMGVFLIGETADNTELLLDYKEMFLLDKKQ